MKYKIVGYVVWQSASWYLRRRYPSLRRNLAIGAGVVLAVGAGTAVVALQRRTNSE